MEKTQFISQFIREPIYLIDEASATGEKSSAEDGSLLVITGTPLSDEDRTFLFKILASVNISPEQLRLSDNDTDLENYSMVFYFGSKPKTVAQYYEKTIVENRMLLAAHHLREISSDKDKKKRLWTALQSCFG